jgi:hypothetical protein
MIRQAARHVQRSAGVARLPRWLVSTQSGRLMLALEARVLAAVRAVLPSVTAPAIVAMQLFLVDALDGLHRIPRRARFDLIARDIQVDLAVAPTNLDDGIG